jgi:hypothetical protein
MKTMQYELQSEYAAEVTSARGGAEHLFTLFASHRNIFSMPDFSPQVTQQLLLLLLLLITKPNDRLVT